jgi:hypothetical protein
MKTKFSRLKRRFAVSDLYVLKCLFHTITLQSMDFMLKVDLCETFVKGLKVSVLNLGTKTDLWICFVVLLSPSPQMLVFTCDIATSAFFHVISSVFLSVILPS